MRDRKLSLALCTLAFAINLSAATRPSAPQPNAADAWSSGEYEYDSAGNIKAIGKDRYAYDTAKRVVAASTENERSGGVARSQEYEYDSFGNRLRSTTTHNDLSRCVTGTLCEENVGVDPRTNRINTNGAQYDVAGNLQSIDAIYRYNYDAVGMMTRQQAPGTTQYIYTAGDERIAIYSAGGWEWSVRDHESRVLRTFTSTDSAPALQWTKDYVYRGNLLLATDARAGRRHYHLDHLGTPRVITDDGGRKLGAHGYHAFGAEVALPFTEQPPERMKFTGHERDVTPDIHTLDYMHARYYSASLGRFLSVDPGGMDPKAPQSWNRYAYARSNPLKYVDPDGRDIYIVVTATVVDDTRVNSRPAGAGAKETVPAYRIVMMNEAGDVDLFAGSRDTNYADQTMKTRGEYGKDHEAPPGSYFGKIRTDGKLGDRIELSDKKGGSSIALPNGTTRQNVQIHVGPGCSQGCVLLTGGKKERNAFMNSVRFLQERERAAGRSDQIHVVIQPRNKKECSGDHCELNPK